MLLDYVRPVDIYDVGYYKLLLRGILVVSLELLLLYIAYNDESPTSFIYFMFGGVIFAFKMRLRANKSFDKEATSVEEREELEIKIRDNIELFKVGVTGRTCYVLFAITMTIIFGCSVFYSKLQNENDAYPFIQLKPDELKTKYLLIVLFISWAVVVMDFTCGRSYHWSELMVYEKFNIKYLQVGIEYVLVYLIFTFSQQVRFSIFSLIFFFFVLLTITVFLISLLRVDKKTVSFGRYISFLKWLTLAGMIVIYLKKSYKKFIDLFGKQQQGGTGNKGNSIKDLIDQFIDKEENFDRILIIFILSTLRQFFADVSNMIDSVRNIIHTKQNIAKESRFVSFFATHILLLMGKRGSDILNYNGNYKLEYFRELAEAPTVLEVFNSIFSKVKLKLSTGQKYYIWAKRILRTILSIAITIFKNHMVVIFQLILNYMVIFKSQNMMLMIMPIIWCMLSFVAFNPGFAVTISIIFLYIPTSLAILQVMASSILCKKNGVIYNWLRLEHYCTFMNTYPILNDTTTTQVISNESEKTRLFTMLTITIFYVILLIERKKNLQYITNTIVTNLDAIGGEVQNILYEDIATLVKFLVSKIFSNFFYICLIFLFMGIIQTISLFNFLFIIFFFYFILKAEKAKQYWIFLLLYLQFLLVTRYLYSLKFFTFNLDRETSAMIGLYFGTGNPVEETRAMTSYWFVLVAISVQYQLFYTKLALEYRRVELEFNSRILEKAKLITIEILIGLRMVYMNTILWAFHFFLVLILIYSERTIFNVILMIMEVIFFFYHLITSKDTNDLNNRRKLNKFWTVMVATILFFSFLFYIFLFCKYTMTKRLISNVLNLRDDVGDTDVLNRQIANEFTMLYLIRQKQLSIEESSFIRENLKIMLAFVSFFKIMLDREEIKKQSENNAVTDMVANEVEELKRQEEELKNALAFGRADSDEEDEEGFEMGELEDSMRNNSGELGDDNPLGMLRDVFTTTKKPVEKLKFGLNDIVQIYDRLLVYLSHIWKSVILIHITVWTQEGPNVFKLLILITVLITFYRYIRAATALMNRSRLFEVIDKSMIC
jgi:hypothetical protein